ncbi:MAG: hypothetical protein ACJ8CB_27950 [Ktedonobacteraceae bacterium]
MSIVMNGKCRHPRPLATPYDDTHNVFVALLPHTSSREDEVASYQVMVHKETLEETEAMAERLDLGQLRVPALSQLCMHYALAGEWSSRVWL